MPPSPPRRRRQYRRTARQAGRGRRTDHERRLCGPAARACCPARWSTSAIRPIRAPTCRSAGSKAMTASRSPARRSTSMMAGRRSTRQIELAREVLKAKTPLFGSCWGLQVVTVAAGGTVRPNPKGREIGIGAAHRADAGRAASIRCMPARLACSTPSRCISTRSRPWRPAPPCWRRTPSPTCRRPRSVVDGAVAWGVQYHPEFSLADMAAIVRRYRRAADRAKASSPTRRRATRYVADLDALDREPGQQAARLALWHRRDRARPTRPHRPRSPTGSRIRCCRRVRASGAQHEDWISRIVMWW